MSTVIISKANAIKAYEKADKSGKQMLSDLLEGQVNFSGKLTDTIKTVDDVFEYAGKDYKAFLEKCKSNGETVDEIAFKIIKLIYKVFNGGWKVDFNDSNQVKWFARFYGSGAAFRFSNSYYVWTATYSDGGSRFCCETEEYSDYIATQFISQFKNLLD